jgi:hypothetical protein
MSIRFPDSLESKLKSSLALLLFGACSFSLGLAFSRPWTAEAQTRPGAAQGAGHAGVTIENFRFRTAGGNTAALRTQRDELVVDTNYGELFFISEVKGRTVLWFRGADGSVRNVLVEDGATPVRITRQ